MKYLFLVLLLLPFVANAQSHNFEKLSPINSKLFCHSNNSCNEDCVKDFFQEALIYLNKNFNLNKKIYNWLYIEFNPNKNKVIIRCENKKIEPYIQKLFDYNSPYFNCNLDTKTKIMSFYSKKYSTTSKVFNDINNSYYVLENL
mgnify:CR=1 FL=1